MTLNSQQVELLDLLVQRWGLDSVGDLVHGALTELMAEPHDPDGQQ